MKDEDLKVVDGIEAAVIRELERRPEIVVPADFAARLAQSLPMKAPSRAAVRPIFGRAAGYAAVIATTVALAILSWTNPGAFEAGRGFLFAVELLLVAQLLGVGYWLGMRKDGL